MNLPFFELPFNILNFVNVEIQFSISHVLFKENKIHVRSRVTFDMT